MDTVMEVWAFLSNEVWPHWIGICYTLVLTVVAQVLKTRLLTSNLAAQYRFVFWMRRIFPLALILMSVIIGLVAQGELAPGVGSAGQRALYLCGCACVSIVGFNVIKQWVKKKYDVDISIGEEKAQ